MPDDVLLARMRDVEPVEAQVSGRPQQIAHRLGADAQGVDVDDPVQVAQALTVCLPLVQRGAERLADAGADRVPTRYESLCWDGTGDLLSDSVMYELVR
ncbi:hypothetical protein SALBM311S_01811 [Streptomyces alboniger]